MVKPAPRTQEEMLADIREQLELLSFRRPGKGVSQVGALPPDVWRHAARASSVAGITLTQAAQTIPGMSVTVSATSATSIRTTMRAMLGGSAAAVAQVTLRVLVDGVQVNSFPFATSSVAQTLAVVLETPISEGVHEVSVQGLVSAGTVAIVSRGAGEAGTTAISVDIQTT